MVARPIMYIIIHNIRYFLPSMLKYVFRSASRVPSPTVAP